MIVIPRVLTGLLREVDVSHARLLSLVFAERAIRACSEVLSPISRDLSLSYISAAKDLVDEAGDISALADAHAAYFEGREEGASLPAAVTWVAAIAVAASCQRQMEDAGILRKRSYMPDLVDVAKEAQIVVGRCAAINEEQYDGDPEIERKARWMEARWQLLYLIESAPIPEN